jgi:hypothetical protein
MAEVKHRNWFLINVDGQEYRAIFKDHGFSYTTVRIDKAAFYNQRKYLLFGPMMKKTSWETVIYNSREDHSSSEIMNRQLFYSDTYARQIVQNLVRTTIKQHATRI